MRQRSKFKILFVDDDEDIQEFLTTFLEIEGYEPIMACDARTGLSKALHESPDLILLDLSLPDDDGFTLCKRMRNHPNLAGIPIYVLSANSDDRTKRYALEAGADRFVEKPFENSELLAMIAGDIGRSSGNV